MRIHGNEEDIESIKLIFFFFSKQLFIRMNGIYFFFQFRFKSKREMARSDIYIGDAARRRRKNHSRHIIQYAF